MNKDILFVLAGNLSTTPRAEKAIRAAMSSGYTVDVLCVNRLNKWKKHDRKLAADMGIKPEYVDLTLKNVSGIIVYIIYKLSRIFSQLIPKSIAFSAVSCEKAGVFLMLKLLFRFRKYRLIEGHSFAAMYPGFWFARKLQVPFVFDVEDFHPGERASLFVLGKKTYLFRELLPKIDAITFASPLIKSYTEELLDKSLKKSVLINNSFYNSEFACIEKPINEIIQLVWFSQSVSYGRGLELIIPALDAFPGEFKLTVIGVLNISFYTEYLNKPNIVCLPIMLQKELHKKLCEFDIGLALELNSPDLNRQICLTNKIFAYAQSGLFSIATDTTAQSDFFKSNADLGIISKQNTDSMVSTLQFCVENIAEIRSKKQERYEYSKQLAFNNEINKLQSIWLNLIP